MQTNSVFQAALLFQHTKKNIIKIYSRLILVSHAQHYRHTYAISAGTAHTVVKKIHIYLSTLIRLKSRAACIIL